MLIENHARAGVAAVGSRFCHATLCICPSTAHWARQMQMPNDGPGPGRCRCTEGTVLSLPVQHICQHITHDSLWCTVLYATRYCEPCWRTAALLVLAVQPCLVSLDQANTLVTESALLHRTPMNRTYSMHSDCEQVGSVGKKVHPLHKLRRGCRLCAGRLHSHSNSSQRQAVNSSGPLPAARHAWPRQVSCDMQCTDLNAVHGSPAN